MSKLQAVTLSRLKPKDKPYTVADGNGLSLLIKTDGTKLWEFRFTSPTKLKRRKSSFGKFPDVPLTLAREKAQNYRELISKEIDPIDKKQEDKIKLQIAQDGIFDKVVDEWFIKQEKELAYSIMVPFFKTSKTSFLILPLYDTSGNSFAPLGSKLLTAL
ncbi:integrase arm-type DNA-binding domain-containing protein [Sulfurimonas sp.]|uniref:integrase arm-type DNA-binding domain-containing protein n=1 Tax=Sulfurimonas sp. TaxID=2022749 RepID=UPI002AB21883|nr:integrase arm-type DNA-binding domain-containing protein [Sulfurimonas sp.]